MAQQGVAVCEIIEVVAEARLAADLRVGWQDRTVGIEDKLSEPTSGVDEPDHRLMGVGHIKQLVITDLCEGRHEAIVSAIPRRHMSRRIRNSLRIVTYSDQK